MGGSKRLAPRRGGLEEACPPPWGARGGLPPAMGGSRRPRSCRASVRGLTTSLQTWGDECFDFFSACGEAGSGDGELDAGGLAFFGFSWQARAPGTRSAMQGTVLWTASSSSSAQETQLGTRSLRLRCPRGFGPRHRRRPIEVLLGARGVRPLGVALSWRIAGKAWA